MTKVRTAWLALLLLGSISAVAAMLTGSWRSPAAVEATSAQVDVPVEPVADNSANATPNWPESAATPDAAARPEVVARQEEAARQVVDPDPAPVLRGSELPASPYPAATEMNANASTNVNVTSRHGHDARSGAKPTASAQQIKKIRNSKAEMRARRRAAANARACAPPTNVFQSLMRKLNLSPVCSSSS